MKIIDTHQHLWDMDLFPYTWCKAYSTLNRSFRMGDYLAAVDGFDVQKTVHVEPNVDDPHILRETQHLLALADQPDNLLGGVVAGAELEKPGFRAYLDQIAHPALKGVRRVMHIMPDELSQGRIFRENLKILPYYGLSFDICALDRQLPLAISLVRDNPEVTFILDHCGVPRVKEQILDPWRSHIREIARFSNVNCKVSGIVAYADPAEWTPEDLRPYVEHVIESFGWERVMFGSDWPVCTLSATLKKWIETLLLLTASASESERSRLFHGNAERIYRLGQGEKAGS